MGCIILTIPGPWTEQPKLDSPFEFEWSGPDPELCREFESLGARSEAFTPAELKALSKHQGVLRAIYEFEGPGDLAPAIKAAKLCLQLCARGALGVYVETGLKVLAPEAFKGLDPTDPITLFHLMVEFYGDKHQIASEGMIAFDLPDVAVPYSPKSKGSAQGAAFALAARMVCDRMRPREGQHFKASESAKAYELHHVPAVEPEDSEDAEFMNPAGIWRMDLCEKSEEN